MLSHCVALLQVYTGNYGMGLLINLCVLYFLLSHLLPPPPLPSINYFGR